MADNPRIADLRKRLEKEPQSRLFAQLAEELRKDGDLGEAIQVARSGLEKNPAYPSARMTLGRALMDSGDVAAAKLEFEAVLKGAADNILASRFLAECLEGTGDVPGAVARYEKTLLLSPGDKHVIARLEELRAKPKEPPRPDAGPAPIPLASVGEEESFEVERSIEPPAPAPAPPLPSQGATPHAPAPVVPRAEGGLGPVVFEFEGESAPEQQTLPPRAFAGVAEAVRANIAAAAPPAPPAPPLPIPPAAPAAAAPGPAVVPRVPPLAPPLPSAARAARAAVPPPAPETGPPLSTATLGELYFNQGFTDKAVEVYRQVLEREPGNDRARARLAEIEALERHFRAEQPPLPGPEASAPVDERAARRTAIEQTIGRLEGLLGALRRG